MSYLDCLEENVLRVQWDPRECPDDTCVYLIAQGKAGWATIKSVLADMSATFSLTPGSSIAKNEFVSDFKSAIMLRYFGLDLEKYDGELCEREMVFNFPEILRNAHHIPESSKQ